MQKYKSNITTTSGAAIRGAPVLVIDEDGNNAALFLDRAGTVPAPNPLTTGPDGVFYFYAVNGRYSIRTTVDGVTITDDDVVLMMDPEEITVAGPIAEAVAAAQAAATAAEFAVEASGIPELVSAAQNAVVDANNAVSQASTAASNAAISKTGADSARDTAVIAKNAAEAALDSFDDRYLGAKAVAPTVDNDGAALLIGALYWDTVIQAMRAWNGSDWVTLQAATAAAISNTPAGSIAATTVQSAIDELDAEKAPLSSPALTGTPTAPTAAPGTNTTQLATTEYARAAAITFGGIKAYETHAEAATAAALLPDGAYVEVSQDETRAGARTRYKVQAGALVFVVNLDQLRLDLAEPFGASLLGWTQAGVGAVMRWVRDKLREHVSLADFMTEAQIADMKTGTPTIDCTPFAAAAFASFGSKGGVVHLPNGCVPLFDTSLNIPDNCELRGAKGFFGRADAPANMNLWAPRIVLNTAATITLNNSSAITKFAIFAKNLTFYGTTAQREAQFVGTAITIADGAADTTVDDGIVLGFRLAVGTTNTTARIDRPRVSRLSIDCLSGVYLKNAYDVGYVREIHGYPFVTLQSTPEPNSAHLKRSGSFIWLDGVNDWSKVTDCFNFGWAVGYKQTDADSVTWLSCGADHPQGATDGSIGYLIEGYCFESRIIGGQVAAKDRGVWVNTLDINGRVTIDALNVWETVKDAIVNERGDVTVSNSGLRNTGGTGNAIYATPTSTRTVLQNVKMNGFAIGIKTDDTTTKVLHDNSDFTGTTVQLNNPYKAVVVSNALLALDGESVGFEVAGNNSIQDIQPVTVYSGKTVTLKFLGAATVNIAGNVKMASNFDFTANDILQIYSDGVNWYQVARSVN